MKNLLNESTPTGYVPRPSEPKDTLYDGERVLSPRGTLAGAVWAMDVTVPESPPDHLLIDVSMTFEGAGVRLDAPGAGVSVEGDDVQEAFRRLVAAVEDHVASASGEVAALSSYASHTWFRFVDPGKTRGERLVAGFWTDGESVEDFIAAATEGRYEEDEPDS